MTTSTQAQIHGHSKGAIIIGGQLGQRAYFKNNMYIPILKISKEPVLHTTVDYGLTKNFSIGLAYGFQKRKWNNGYSSVRTDIAARILYNYGYIPELNLYSGIRLGYKMDRINSPNYQNSTEDDKITFGVVLLGFKYWFNERIGFSFEAQLGRPYITNLGVVFCLN